MTYETIIVDIFETTANLWLGPFHFQETKPMYAAMIPGSDHYYCFTEQLENLPRELAQVAGYNKRVIPKNLGKEGYFKNISFGDSEQGVMIRHTPLSPSQLENFVSAAIRQISFFDRELNRHDRATKVKSEKEE